MSDYVLVNSSKAQFLVEVSRSDVDDQLGALRGAGTATSALSDISQVGDAIVAACDAIFAPVQSAVGELAPDELEVEFSVSISAEGGVPIVAKVSGEATFAVKATWRRGTS